MTGTRLERLLRKRENPREISFHELFFDLAIIFALTRVSQRLLSELSLLNAAESLVLLGAIYWVWVATAWSTDWFNPEEFFLQRLILGIMFAGLLMASAVSNAYNSLGFVFAGAYTAVHIGRALVIVPALRGHPLQARSTRVAIWFGISAIPWLVGALLPEIPRLVLWALAMALDVVSAYLGWPVPRMGGISESQLRVVGEHIAERYRQLFIISLSAPVLMVGLTYSRAGLDYLRTLALALLYVNVVLMLWAYFLPLGRSLAFAVDKNGPRIAVIAGYCHGIMMAGVVVTAVGGQLLVLRPFGEVRAAWSVTIIAGNALYIIGRTALNTLGYRVKPLRGGIAVLVIAAMTPGLLLAPLIVVAIAVNLVLLGLVLSLRRRPVNLQGVSRRATQ